MKKFISLLLVLATVLSCFMLTVSADEFIVSDEGNLPFEDVKTSHWFYQAVRFCYANEIIKGMNDYTFGFSGQLTRAQFVTMLANLEGVDTSTYTVTQFPDVKSSHWYYGAVAWGYSEGIVSGMNDGSFAPNKSLSRAELAVIMKNYMDGKYEVEVSDSVLDKFTDKPKSEYWYYEAMKFAVSAELLSGNSDGTLASTGTVTRAQAAVIFKSFMEKYYYGDCEHSFTEADCTNAATCEKCGLVDDLPMGHFLTAYDCVTGGKCSVCEAEVEPSKLIHDWNEADCTLPKRCAACKITVGEPIGHTTSNGICNRCEKELFPTAFDKVVYYTKMKGTYDKESNCYTYIHGTSIGPLVLLYDASSGELGLNVGLNYGDGEEDMTFLELPKYGNTAEIAYAYFYYDNIIFYGEGRIDDIREFHHSSIPTLSTYEGNPADLAVATENMTRELRVILNYSTELLYKLCEMKMSDFGFAYYYV